MDIHYLFTKIKAFVTKYAIPILVVLILILLGLRIYDWYNDNYIKRPITYESQTEATTVEGVTKAAEHAQVHIDKDQAQQVVKEIHTITEKQVEPVYIVQTTPEKTDTVIKEEVKKNKADYAIVTNPDNPDEVVDVSKLDPETEVNLHQYNIHAYKKVIRTISYAPGEKIAGFSVQKKINDHGTYMGIGVDYDMDDQRVYGKVMFSW